jgi:hypothetical protein
MELIISPGLMKIVRMVQSRYSPHHHSLNPLSRTASNVEAP